MGISNSLIHGTRGQQHKFLLLSAPQCVLKLCSSLLTLPESARHKKQKSPQLRGLRDTLLHLTTGCSQTRNHSHSMINAVLKHYKINKIALYLHVDTIQNTMVRKLGDCTDRVARRKTLLD